MHVFFAKLDNLNNKKEWWIRNFEINTYEDIIKIQGICAKTSYAEVYNINKNDDPILVDQVRNYIQKNYPTKGREIIMLLFKLIQGEIV